jgi:hypothetical protein
MSTQRYISTRPRIYPLSLITLCMDLLSLPESGAGIIVVAIFFFIIGYFIKFRGWTSLLAGHNPNNVTDESAVADLGGKTVFLVGIITLVYGGLTILGVSLPFVESLVAIAILFVVGQYIYRVRRYAA